MDEHLKKQVYFFGGIFLILIAIYSVYNYFSLKKTMSDDILIVDRSPLNDFRLLEIYEGRDGKKGVYIDIVNVDNGRKYEEVFVADVCLNMNNNKPGKIMKLSLLVGINPHTEAPKFSFERAYDYLCTNKDMAKEDADLLKKIEEVRNKNLETISKWNFLV